MQIFTQKNSLSYLTLRSNLEIYIILPPEIKRRSYNILKRSNYVRER
jgi:hypothetical protein